MVPFDSGVAERSRSTQGTESLAALAALAERSRSQALSLPAQRSSLLSLTKQLSVSAGTHEVNGIAFKLVDQEKIATNMAFTEICPIALERVI